MAKRTPANHVELTRYRINPQLILRRVVDSTLVGLAAPEADALRRRIVVTKLDASATAMLDLLHAPHDLNSLIEAVASRYGLSADTVQRDVEAALEMFVHHEWVHTS